MATRRAPRLPDPVEAALDALARALRASSAGGRDAQRVQAAVRNRVAALTAAPAGQLAAADLARSLRVLDISMSEAGRLFGVSRSAVEQWLVRGVPRARLARAANLARIADILERNLKPERIAAVVREPARAYGTKSILDLVREGRDEEARAALERAFDWSRTA
jgi:predicted transcriptional regulator